MTTTDTSVHDGMPMHDYLALPHISSSQLKLLLRGRRYYEAKMARPSKPTPDMYMGTAIHSMLLTPQSFKDEVRVAPKCSTRTTKIWKDWEAEQPKGMALLLQHEYEACRRAVDAVLSNSHWRNYLNGMDHRERTMVWSDDAGVTFKARVDAAFDTPAGAWLVDLKTCANATTAREGDGRPFHYVAYEHRYHMQLAHYRRGWQACCGPVAGCLLLAIEKHAPYTARLYDISSWLEHGDTLIDMALARLDEHDNEDVSVQTLPMPSWAKYQENTEEN